MKDFKELTDEELVALTDEELKKHCLLQAAEDGIQLPGGVEPPPFAEVKPSYDLMLYNVMGCSFIDRASAEELQAFLLGMQHKMRSTDHNWQYGSSERYVTGFEREITIVEQSAFSAERYAEFGSALQLRNERKTESDAAIKEWKRVQEVYIDHVAWMTDKIAKASRMVHLRERNDYQFQQYLEVANGDADTAWSFFMKADLEIDDYRPKGAPSLEPTTVPCEEPEDGPV